MTTRELSEEELEEFLSDLGISDSVKSEVSQIVAPPPLPDHLLLETSKKPQRFPLWVPLGILGAFLVGFIAGALLTGKGSKVSAIQKQLDSLSEKISSYEELTKPKYELIEPLISPTPLDTAV